MERKDPKEDRSGADNPVMQATRDPNNVERDKQTEIHPTNTTADDKLSNEAMKALENTNNRDNINTNTKVDNENNRNKEGKESKEPLRSKLVETLKQSASGISLTLGNGLKNKEEKLLKSSKTVQKFSPLSKQTLAATGSIMATLAAGLTSGYSAILLPKLKEPGSPIPGDDETASWIAAMAALPMALGCLISGWMMERWGRRTSHLILCVPFVLGWVLISCANGLTMMLFGRFFTGLCVGLLGPLGPVYIAETSDPKYRGFFLAAVSLAIAVGILIAHVIGTFLHWKLTALICSVCPLACYLILSFVPESPTWLISKGRRDDGIKAFNWLRGYDDAALDELKGILEKQEVAAAAPKPNIWEQFGALKRPEVYKPLVIMILFFLTCQFSGVNAVAFYSVEIMQKTLGDGMDRYVAMIIVDAVRVVMSVAACILVRRYGRRPLAVFSGVVTALSLIGLAAFLMGTRHTNATHLSWIPLSLLILYICAISVGIVPLPWIMCGEVFPTEVRGLGSGLSSAVAFGAFFAVVKTAPGMLSTMGDGETYLTYGVVAAVGTVIMFFILPETKGRSLQEIEDDFKSEGKKDKGVV